MVTTTMPAPEAQARINHFGRLIGVFVSPKQTLASIAERPSWLAPLVLLVVLGTSVGALLNTKMNWGEYIRHKAEENARFSQLSEEQKDQAVAGQIKFWSSFSYGAAIVFVPLSTLFFALIYWGAFNLFSGAGLLAAVAMLAVLVQTSAFGYFYWSRILPGAQLDEPPVPLPLAARFWPWLALALSLAWGLQAQAVGQAALAALQSIGVSLPPSS